MTIASPRSFRSRLRRGLLTWLLVALGVGGAAVYFFVRIVLTAQFDDALLVKATALASAVKLEDLPTGRAIEFDFVDESMPEFERARDPEYFELWQLAGAGEAPVTLHRSRSMGSSTIGFGPAPRKLGGSRASTATFADVALPDGRPGRGVWLPGHARHDHDIEDLPTGATTGDDAGPDRDRAIVEIEVPILLVVARDRREIDGPMTALLSGMSIGAALLAIGTTLAIRWAVGSGLRPLDDLGRAVAALDPSDLPPTLQAPPLPQELEPVRWRIEELLARVRATIQRERRFGAAAAHELRTPLAELGALLDVRVRWPDGVDQCVGSLREGREIVERMERLVEMLLAIATEQDNDALARRPSVEPIDVTAEIDGAVARHAPTAAAAGVDFVSEVPRGIVASGDRSALASIVDNLLSNAVGHSPRGGRIDVRLRRTGPADAADGVQAGAVLEVRNGPTDLASSDLPRLIEPFWRKDAARSRSANGEQHLGLGLAIVDALARREGATLEATLDDRAMLCLRVAWRE